MDTKLLQEVLQCLCGERTVFYYYRDQYAVYLLQRLAAKQGSLVPRELRNSQWAGLLNRPALQQLVANCGAGVVNEHTVGDYWFAIPEPYVLTLGRWGQANNYRWAQTSRPGANLVLQLNLSSKWSRAFQRTTQRSANSYLDRGHPVSESRGITLAWARLDADFSCDEVLIEEIQSDLVRDVRAMYRLATLNAKRDSFHFRGVQLNRAKVLAFGTEFLAEFEKTWQEAILTAAIQFSFEELGLSQLYYHSVETGNTMKNISYRKPPRSLYSELPKKFCFMQTTRAPRFLREEKRVRRNLKKLANSRWFHMVA